jgi:hypothetical protein
MSDVTVVNDDDTILNLPTFKDDMLDGVYDLAGDSILGKNLLEVSIAIEDKTENQIENEAKPTKTDKHLRVSFWEEVRRAEEEGVSLIQTNIFRGICSENYWIKLVKEKPHKLAYIMCPLRSYEVENRLLHNTGQQRMFEILSVSPVKADGKLDKGLADLQLKVYKFLDDKRFGQAVQRVQKHSTSSTGEPESVDDLEKKLEDLKNKQDHNG